MPAHRRQRSYSRFALRLQTQFPTQRDAEAHIHCVLAHTDRVTCTRRRLLTRGVACSQVDFEDARSEALRNGRLSGARRHSMERFQAARTRIQSIAPGAFIANKLRAKLHWTPRRVVLRDKLTFTLGVAHIMVSMYWLGYSPSTFYQLYTVKAGLLMPLRFVLYKRDKMHYYLLDFCYYANLLLILQAWALPEWCLLEKALFSFATGPLAWSIILFRNSMIFHSLDKVRPCLPLAPSPWPLGPAPAGPCLLLAPPAVHHLSCICLSCPRPQLCQAVSGVSGRLRCFRPSHPNLTPSKSGSWQSGREATRRADPCAGPATAARAECCC